MPALSAGDLTNIRTRPIARRWTLYLYQPVTVWTGTVGGSPSRGDRSLTVSTVSGDPADILADSTIWVRDSGDGLKDYPSKVRARAYAGGTLTVADNNIDWAAGDKLYAKRLFEIWPRTVYIDSGGTQYKDRDVAYIDDATTQNPKANGGPAAIGTLSGGLCDLVFVDTGSFAVPGGGAVSSYQWSAIGGSPAVQAGGEATSTVTYRYSTAGYYYVKLIVTDANTKTGHVYIPVIVDDGTYGVSVLATSRYWDNYGWVMERILTGLDADESVFYDGAPLFLVADSGQTATNAFAANRTNLRFSGWLIEDNTDRAWDEREIRYRAVSSAHILATIPAWPIGLRPDASPSDWYELTTPNLDSIAKYLLEWHSTALQVCDWRATGEWTNRTSPGENCHSDGSLLEQIDYVYRACKANLRCDRQGILRAMRHEWYLSAAEEAARATVMTLTSADFQSARYGTRPHRARIREVRALGVDGSSNPYMSGAPGDSPLDGGRPGELDGMRPISQSELNQWAGQALSDENWSVPLVLRLSGEYDAFDPALGEYVAGSLSSYEDKLPDGPFSVLGMRFEDDHRGGFTLSELELIPDPSAYGAYTGETRTIPTTPDEPAPDDLPPFDEYPVVLPTEWPTRVAVITNAGVFYTTDFSGMDTPSTQPTWNDLSANLPASPDITAAGCDPTDPLNRWYIQFDTDHGTWPGAIYLSDDQGASWTRIFDLSDCGGVGQIKDMVVDKITGRVYALWVKDAGDIVVVYYSDNQGASWSSVSTGYNRNYGADGIDAWNTRLSIFHCRATVNSFEAVVYDGSWGDTDQIGSSTFASGPSAVSPLDAYYYWQSWSGAFRWAKGTKIGAAAYVSWPGSVYPVPGDTDSLWFHPGAGGHVRMIYTGSWASQRASQIGITDDHFAATDVYSFTDGSKLLYNVARMAWMVRDERPAWAILGASGYTGAIQENDTYTPTPHVILVADMYENPERLYGKAGAMCATSPYTDSIPRTAGSPVRHGILICN